MKKILNVIKNLIELIDKAEILKSKRNVSCHLLSDPFSTFLTNVISDQLVFIFSNTSSIGHNQKVKHNNGW
ncbi:MAG: hypothetical protein JW870_01430 [Candidatus Delongbacteria bacterium]|nr:hypothetical protein [Candidatus Delongbacteria bacterium]